MVAWGKAWNSRKLFPPGEFPFALYAAMSPVNICVTKSSEGFAERCYGGTCINCSGALWFSKSVSNVPRAVSPRLSCVN